MAITSDYGPKRYDWATYWHLASGLESEKDYFLKNNDKLRAFAIENQMLFNNPPINDLRARNDPHLNEGGHHAKAESLYQFLILNFNRQILLR